MRIKKINGIKYATGIHYYCIVCNSGIWPYSFQTGTMDNYDIEIKPNEWLVTCGQRACQELLHINPLAYEL
jgi:hypothetical protein